MNLPFPSKRAPAFADVPDEKWNDWRWQLSHRLNTAEDIEKIIPADRERTQGARRPPTSSGWTSPLISSR